MALVAIANQKGGVGKTTTAINLGAALARAGRRILLVDADPQSNASSGLHCAPSPSPTLYDALAGRAAFADCVRPTTEERLWLVPATPDMAGAEVELATVPGREFLLRHALRESRAAYDVILIDCAPSLGLLTLNALAAADAALIPVQCEYLALEGLGHLLHTIDLVRQDLNPNLAIAGLVLTMFDSRTKLSAAIAQEVRQHCPQTFRTVVPRSVRLSEAPSFGQTIFQYAAGSRGAAAYRELATEFLLRLEPATGDPPPEAAASAAPTAANPALPGALR